MSDLKTQLRCNPKIVFEELLKSIEKEISVLKDDLPSDYELVLEDRGDEHTLELKRPNAYPKAAYYLQEHSQGIHVSVNVGTLETRLVEVQWDEDGVECRLIDGDAKLSVDDLTRRLIRELLEPIL